MVFPVPGWPITILMADDDPDDKKSLRIQAATKSYLSSPP
jgi:hypothetical protein